MILSLQTTWRRLLFGAPLLGVATTLAYLGTTAWLASSYADSTDPRKIRRAISLEPSNAEHHHRVGRLRQADFLEGNLEQAVQYYRRATRLNPYSARYWLDLGGAYEQASRVDSARNAYERAKTTYPISARVAWAYGNFLLRQGDLGRGFAEIRRALTVEPGWVRLAVPLCWRVIPDVDRLLREALPPQSSFYFAALHYFLSLREVEPALTTWHRLLALKEPFELNGALPLLEVLIQEERIREAEQVWREALQKAGWDRRRIADNSLVWDGGFEQEPVNGGFGWRQRSVGGASFAFDTTTQQSGSRSLRIVFEGTANVDFQHLIQYVAVEPLSHYRFSAFLRTEGISTDSGIRFRIFDPNRPRMLNLLTPGLLGSEPWSRQDSEFSTGPETRMVAVALRRIPSRKFDNKLRGTVWVDDVSLTPVAYLTAH